MTTPADTVSTEHLRAFAVLQASLVGEHWFIEQVRERMLAAEAAAPGGGKIKPGTSYETLLTRDWHNHVIQLVQFFFFLEALECKSPVQIARFIDNHNEKVERDLESGTHPVSPKELRRAIFTAGKNRGKGRKEQLVATFNHYGKPVFTASELGHLLIDIMSPKTTEKILEDLKQAGLVHVRGGDDDIADRPLDTDPRRELLELDPFLVETYTRSLLMAREEILNGSA